MGNKLFVGNLSFEASEQDLRDLFSADARKVASVAIITDRDSGRSRGFGFVEFGSASDAAAAIEALDGTELHGRPLRVNEAHDKPKGGGGGRSSGGGYRNRY
ncbi:MAG: RNA recognition motif domain-containing protein [Planctomycetota bacterium]|jgi:RNA recognition motif-containing protein